MKFKNCVFLFVLMFTQSLFCSGEGNISFSPDGTLVFSVDSDALCIGAGINYDLSLHDFPKVVETTQNIWAKRAQQLIDEGRLTEVCGNPSYGTDPQRWHLSIYGQDFASYNLEEIKEMIGQSEMVIPVDITYLETPIDSAAIEQKVTFFINVKQDPIYSMGGVVAQLTLAEIENWSWEQINNFIQNKSKNFVTENHIDEELEKRFGVPNYGKDLNKWTITFKDKPLSSYTKQEIFGQNRNDLTIDALYDVIT